MTTFSEEIDRVCEEEGFRSEFYEDHMGNMTIGHGIHRIEPDESRLVVSQRMHKLHRQILANKTHLITQPDEVMFILVHMAYQMGLQGLYGFGQMFKAIKLKDYEWAADEMLNSKWAQQTPARTNRLADRMRALV